MKEHCQDVPGIQLVPSWKHHFVVPSERISALKGQLMYWSGHSLKESIRIYTSHGLLAFIRLYRTLDTQLRRFGRSYDSEHSIPYSLLRVWQHFSEWRISADKTPFKDLSSHQKSVIQERLASNRKRTGIAQQQQVLKLRT